MINTEFLGATGEFIVMTLWEGACGHTGPWAISVFNEQYDYQTTFVTADLSPSPGRYQIFRVRSVAQADIDLLNGEFYVQTPGQYFYKAYPYLGNNTLPISPSDIGPEAERGTWFIRKQDSAVAKFEKDEFIPVWNG